MGGKHQFDPQVVDTTFMQCEEYDENGEKVSAKPFHDS